MSGTRTLDLRLQVRPDAPAEARREVGALADTLPPELREDLQLLVSELVANSLRHAQLTDADWISLHARIGPETVRVEVSDPGRRFEPLHGRDPGTLGSRSGLWMLNQIANRWGLVRDGATRVWFETDLPNDRPAPPWVEAIRNWPETAREQALDIARLYGGPDEFDADSLTWRCPDVGVNINLRRTEPQTPV
jgi:anti-sigma regulatory factor (Ser/Thr protein kinase)